MFPYHAELVEGEDEREKFKSEVIEDKSLEKLRQCADRRENGYWWKNGVLMHSVEGDAGETWERVVVPVGRRKKVLWLAHSVPTAGHLSDRKTHDILKRHYVWPGIARDVKGWCKSCPKCQRVKGSPHKKVPLQPMPVITEPFEVMAFDLVGPYERSQHGYKYVLTAMCLASKYPEAIPLKDIRAETVAEAMVEIFSRTGVPQKMLTDQGSQFVGHLNQQLCKKLNIEKVRTSAYHPQTNGCLERWHGTLNPMIKKSIQSKKDWEKQLKYALFAYRSAPHANTGFSPFEIIYGRQVRGPLELLKEALDSQEKEQVDVCKWEEQLQERLEIVRDTVRERETKAKAKMKAGYDKKAKPREFQEGSMVLLRIPGMAGKLEDAWDGP